VESSRLAQPLVDPSDYAFGDSERYVTAMTKYAPLPDSHHVPFVLEEPPYGLFAQVPQSSQLCHGIVLFFTNAFFAGFC
jgi:hypothetical protein